ncbi:[protein-PII] uridylyltransferase [Kaustia mangrovi]|uniref:Bifunctional uridylyltransferase/uridylyl-removing enzyme n=1 Tax=Kaustia mangrovi TaxID=2593653 RepID=A0A7S8C4U9_9HYPH|nr:[protein-PII] uridylyltransferase [Kaustia mangrovi]QPC43421.1 [protein-PII] uridylyltransferase [Kaustia mangrovi]
MTKRKPRTLIDSDALRHELTALYRSMGDDQQGLRAKVLARLKEVMAEGRAEAERRLMETGKGTQCAANLSHIQDELIRVIYDFTVVHVYRARNPSAAERLSVVAVGGYGRGTLAPGSDIDLLFLLPYKQTPWGESVVEYMLYMLWDMGLKVGHATRSVDECIRLAKTDQTILTAVLEARYLWGDKALYDELVARFRKEIVAHDAKAFIAAKLAEREARHARSGASRYLVEPDVKDGKGGLRDLHTLFWIAKFVYGTDSPSALVKAGVFTRAEYRRFKKREDFLWAVRCHLHFMTGRGDDRLSFDRQAELAERLGYTARGRLRHVERFMKHYFLVAKDVGDLTRIFCAVLEAQEMKKAPTMSRMLLRLRRRAGRGFKESDAFRLDAGRITVAHDEVFREDPVNLLRLFHLACRYNTAIHPHALKLVRRSLWLIDDTLRRNTDANRLFLDMLTSKRDPETILRRLNEAGVLGKFIPDFGRIVAHMQFNMYHHYTVDEHLIRAVGILSEIERGELAEDLPLLNDVIHKVKNRRVLYVAVFLHDIAKGRKESHSIAGERVAKALCPRLGLEPAETETVAWLVRHHLDMSDFAQMRDLNDFKTILDFAGIVQSPERLRLLLALTVADIKAVGPGVWNGWKGLLLRTIYFETEPILSGGHTRISRQERLEEAQRLFAEAMPDWSARKVKTYLKRHYEPYWLNVDTAHQVAHAKLIDRAEKDGEVIATAVETDEFTAITELTVFAPDHPRLLALLTGACAAGGANIASAQIFTTTDGMALDTLLIQRELADEADERRRAARVEELIGKAFAGELRIPEMIARNSRMKGRIRAFTVEPQVIIDNDSSNRFTVIEVNGLDRIGFLHDLTDALFRLNLNIASAQIATFGERAVDVFYVTDLTGAKITNAARRGAIQRHLLTALAPGGDEGDGGEARRRRAAPVRTLG